MGKTLHDLRKEIINIYKEYNKQGTKPWTYDIAAQDLQYQLGSLAKRLMQLKGYRYAEGKSPEELKNLIADELADILAEVLFISAELNIDLDKAWEKMVESDREKIRERTGT